MEYSISNVISAFGFELIDSQKIQKSYKCITTDGIKELKEVMISKEKIMLEDDIKKYLIDKDFKGVTKYILNPETNLPYMEVGNKIYTLSDYIEGSECELEKSEDLKYIVETLAKLHIALKGYEFDEELKPSSNDVGKLVEFYNKRKNELLRNRKKINKNIVLDEFDKVYVNNVDMFLKNADLAIEILLNSKYEEIVENTIKEKILCHNDYAFHNIIKKENTDSNACESKQIYVFGFENVNYEIRMYDLANVIKRKMRKCNWDINIARDIIEIYNEISKIEKEELEVLYAMLVFPQKFWRIVNKHYNTKKVFSLDNDLLRLNNEILEEKYHKEFITNYKTQILDK